MKLVNERERTLRRQGSANDISTYIRLSDDLEAKVDLHDQKVKYHKERIKRLNAEKLSAHQYLQNNKGIMENAESIQKENGEIVARLAVLAGVDDIVHLLDYIINHKEKLMKLALNHTDTSVELEVNKCVFAYNENIEKLGNIQTEILQYLEFKQKYETRQVKIIQDIEKSEQALKALEEDANSNQLELERGIIEGFDGIINTYLTESKEKRRSQNQKQENNVTF